MEQNAKFVVRLDESERGRLQQMVDQGQGAKTIRNRAWILLKTDEGEGGPPSDFLPSEAFYAISLPISLPGSRVIARKM